MFQLLFCVCLIVQITDSYGKKYGEKFKEISNSGELKKWKPKMNKVFENKDESEIKKYMGVNPQLKQKAEKGGGRKKATSKLPKSNTLKGRSLTASDGGDSWRNKDKYKTNYWEKDNNGSADPDQADTNPADRPNTRNKRLALPTNFDWRNHSNCKSLFDVRYQQCGDCWSVSCTSVMSDRYCLSTWKNKFFSARQITTCVYSTGGCEGGWTGDAMDYYKTKGVASGGDPTIYTEPIGCLPYPKFLNNTSKCPTVCNSKSALDSTKAGDYYEINSKNVTEIMNEIYENGPVVAIMEVFEDFVYYGDGMQLENINKQHYRIYHHVYGDSWGYHAIRVIGYGVENNTAYWIVANSWGAEWGESGYFKILRGTNHCDIESWITTVFPAEAYV